MSTIMLTAFCDEKHYDAFDGFSKDDDYILTRGDDPVQAEANAEKFMHGRYFSYAYERVHEDIAERLDECRTLYSEDFEEDYGPWEEWLGKPFELLKQGENAVELDWDSAKVLMELLDY